MNKTIKFLLAATSFVFFTSYGFAQEATEQKTAEDAEVDAYAKQQTVIYRLAKYFGDSDVARSALYNLVSLNTQNTSLLDTLALEYYESGKWLSAALVSKEVNKINPEDEFALEISASSLENLGAKDKSLDAYESLYLKNENIGTLYKIAFLQFELNKFVEAKVTCDALLSKPEAKELKIVFPKADKSEQEVSMEASICNLRGLIALEEKSDADAKLWFEKALVAAPGFELAKANLDKVSK